MVTVLEVQERQFCKRIKKTLPSLIGALVVTLLVVWSMGFTLEELAYSILIFSTSYAVLGNLDYWLRFLKGKLNHAGATIAHVDLL
jgi:hypothetical protein